MATWQKVITAADNADYKNETITLAQLTTALDGESGYENGKILKVVGGNVAFAADSGGIALTDLSVTAEPAASGNGAIAYNNTNGEFTYTPPANLPDQSVSTSGSPSFADDLYVKGAEGADATIHLWSDEGDDTADKWSIKTASSGASFSIYQNTTEEFKISSSGYLEITGSISIGGNAIKAGDGATALTLSETTGNVETSGALTLGGNIVGGTHSATAWNLTASGGDLTCKNSTATTIFEIDSSSASGTMTGDFTITGDLTIQGDTTTVSTTNLVVEDKQIVIANGSTNLTGANGSGIIVDMGSTASEMPDILWNSGRGGGNTDGSGTANGLTGWSLSNSLTSNFAQHPIAIIDFGTADMGASDNGAGPGSFYLNTDDNELFIRTA